MPAAVTPQGHGDPALAGMHARLTTLERAVGAMATEVVTGRLVVVDPQGRPRLVAEVTGGTVELRLQLPDGAPDVAGAAGRRAIPDDPVVVADRTAVVLYATSADDEDGGGNVCVVAGPDAGPDGVTPRRPSLGPSVGLQLWADGDSVAEMDAWPDENGRWLPHAHPAPGP